MARPVQLHSILLFAKASVLSFALACSPGDNAGDTSTAAMPGGDTAMTGMDPSMPGMAARPPAQDADHEFLRMMVDHHQGLVVMASAAMTQATQPQTQTDARTLHAKQEKEIQDMVAMIQRDYGETITPHVMGSNQAMVTELASKSGLEYDKTFYRNIIQHHRGAVTMIDEYLPRATKPAVRQMAERMKTEQQREITEMEQRLQQLG